MVTDLQGTIELANDKMLRITGLRREQVIGQEFPYSWLMRPGKKNSEAPVDRAWQFEATEGVEGTVTDAGGTNQHPSDRPPRLGGPLPYTCYTFATS
jgi:PAS domain S-box-containing protein